MASEASGARTQSWRERVEAAESISELRKLLIALRGSAVGWSRFFLDEMVSRGIKTQDLVPLCGVTRQTISRWRNQNILPRSREQFINIAMAFGMTQDETDHMLQRFGLYPKLYSRNIRDAVRIYAIESRMKRTDEAVRYDDFPYGYVRALDERLNRMLERWSTQNRTGRYAETWRVSDMLGQITSADELEEYLLSNLGAFPRVPYQKLSHWIDTFIDMQDDGDTSIHALVESGVFDTRFNNLISGLKRHGEVPPREMLIVLGIRFNMTVEMLDRMLALGGGEPLCARVPEEMALIFAIRSAHLYNPVMEYDVALRLRGHARNREIRSQAEGILRDYDRVWGAGEPKVVEYGDLADFVRYVLKKLERELPGAAEKYCPM